MNTSSEKTHPDIEAEADIKGTEGPLLAGKSFFMRVCDWSIDMLVNFELLIGSHICLATKMLPS